MPDPDVDVAVVGAGGAGSLLLLALDARCRATGADPPRVAVIDPVRKAGNDRTWCFWDAGHAGALEAAVSHSWRRLEVVGRTGAVQRLDLEPWRYAMVRSGALYALADEAATRLGVHRVTAAVDAVSDGDTHATVEADGQRLRAGWVFDSRPRPPDRAGSTMLLQHFRGWTVRGDFADGADGSGGGMATLMDFSVPQPAGGVAFGYCLPVGHGTALVEYTEFSRQRLPSEGYDRALRAYLDRRWPGAEPVPGEVEDGVIPMTDGVFAARDGHRLFRLGTAGGATRASTGYTFAAMRRQAAGVAAALLEGRVPVPPAAYPGRHRWMDAVLLRALDGGGLSGAELLAGMFRRNPVGRMLRFMDGTSSPGEELALMAVSTPNAVMLRATASDARARLQRRLAEPSARPRSPSSGWSAASR